GFLKNFCNNSASRNFSFGPLTLVLGNLWTYRKMVHHLRVITLSFSEQNIKVTKSYLSLTLL
ncbi:MAG: hypothetical protein IKF66_01525, partial [Methanobrevibacter sp.]|nr:hypothetical protein [Methanobrevibacter sp.]